MSHEVIQELLSAYLDDDLSSEERQRVDEHLAVCEDCRDELALLRLTVDALHDMPVLRAPGGFTDAVLERIDADAPAVSEAPAEGAKVVPLERRKARVLIFAPVALAAAASLVVGMVWWMVPRFTGQEAEVFASRSDAVAEADSSQPAATPTRSATTTLEKEKAFDAGDALADLEVGMEEDRAREMREQVPVEERPAPEPAGQLKEFIGGLAGAPADGVAAGSTSTGERSRGGGVTESKDGAFTPWESPGGDLDALADAPAAPPAAGGWAAGTGAVAIDAEEGELAGYRDAENERRVGESKLDDGYFRREEADEGAAATAEAGKPTSESEPDYPAGDAVADTDLLGAEMEDDFDADLGEDELDDYSRYDDAEEEEAESISLRRGSARDRDDRRSRAEAVTRASGRAADKGRGGPGAKKAKKSETPSAGAPAAREITVEEETAAGDDATAALQAVAAPEATETAPAAGRARWVLQTSRADALVQLDALCDGNARIRCSFVAPNRSPVTLGGEGIDQTITIHVTRDGYDGWKRDLSALGSLHVQEQVVDGLAPSDEVVLTLTLQFRP